MTKKQSERYANQYATLCNLIEGIWLKRKDKDYFDVDLDNLPNLTSPQARKIALFIMQTLEVQ